MGANSSDADIASGLLRSRRRLSLNPLVSQAPNDAAPLVIDDWLFDDAGGGLSLVQSARFDNAQAFYAAVVSPGAVGLTPTRLDGAQTFYAVTVTAGAVNLLPSRLDNAQSFYGPTVALGPVQLQPGRLDNTNSFFSAAVTAGSVSLDASRLDNASTFYAHAVAPGAVGLLPSLFANDQTWYGHTVTGDGFQNIAPERFDNESVFFTHTIEAAQSTPMGGWFGYPLTGRRKLRDDDSEQDQRDSEVEVPAENVQQAAVEIQPAQKRKLTYAEITEARRWVDGLFSDATIAVQDAALASIDLEQSDLSSIYARSDDDAIALIMLMAEA